MNKNWSVNIQILVRIDILVRLKKEFEKHECKIFFTLLYKLK